MKAKLHLFACLLFSFLFLFLLKETARAEFRNDVWGARPLALGGAYIGVPGDAYTPFSNPAGIAQAQSDQATLTLGKPKSDGGNKSTLGAVSYVDASSNTLGTFGFWWTHMSTSSVNRENTVAMSFGRPLSTALLGDSLSYGFNIKYLSNLSLVPPRRDQSGLSADLGLMLMPTPRLALGAVARDITRPHVSVAADERIPITLGAGASLWLGDRTMAAVDLVKGQTSGGAKVRAGLETWLLGPVGLRIGTNSDQVSYGLAVRGGSPKGFQGQIEYAYADPYDLKQHQRLHMITLRARFGRRDRDRELSRMSKEDYMAKKRSMPASEKMTPALLKANNIIEQRNAIIFGPGDVLEIHVQNHPELDVSSVTVDSWGFVRLPYIGDLEVKGFSKEKIEAALSKIYGEFFKEPPVVDVSVKEFNSRIVYVLGQVKSPGKYIIENSLTLRDAITLAGLPTERAANWRVFVIRQGKDGPVYIHVNFYRVLFRGHLENNIELMPGDIVYVPVGYLDGLFLWIGRILNPIFGLADDFVRPAVP